MTGAADVIVDRLIVCDGSTKLIRRYGYVAGIWLLISVLSFTNIIPARIYVRHCTYRNQYEFVDL